MRVDDHRCTAVTSTNGVGVISITDGHRDLVTDNADVWTWNGSTWVRPPDLVH